MSTELENNYDWKSCGPIIGLHWSRITPPALTCFYPPTTHTHTHTNTLRPVKGVPSSILPTLVSACVCVCVCVCACVCLFKSPQEPRSPDTKRKSLLVHSSLQRILTTHIYTHTRTHTHVQCRRGKKSLMQPRAECWCYKNMLCKQAHCHFIQ